MGNVPVHITIFKNGLESNHQVNESCHCHSGKEVVALLRTWVSSLLFLFMASLLVLVL